MRRVAWVVAGGGVVQEAKWEAFTKYCADRVQDLEAVKAESASHALHEGYSLNRLFQR
jgi:hypothetical protein